MNKQQLANKIWQSANKMRSKIEASEYKDFILGFMFYKFLSDKQENFLLDNDWTKEDITLLVETEETDENGHINSFYADEVIEDVKFIQDNIGYFIGYKHLFSTWLDKGKDFSVDDVRVALSAFSRYITQKKVFEGVFQTLETGLSKLGSDAGKQTKAISDLIELIQDIPMDGKQDYDVLGFIYEYLIGMFAANAGKKAGEFYTPHEVSLLMSEIIAEHLKDREEIQIYDPTSGSGSLLINIGQSVAKHMNDVNNIKYFAQELKQNTYNLTRMNLVMRGILSDNIYTRNADTLEDDWPYFDEQDPINSYKVLHVDAVVSNPPYSQAWSPDNKEVDPRYSRFGLAPKTKADYAFLLHDLYHLKPDGIMTIVLPHGVLFRGGEEEKIRKNLIEFNHIDAIIGLPANVFFGTGIPTITMVLKQKRETNDVLIIDASKEFTKEGKNNKLQASHIKKISDTVAQRKTIDKYAKVVSLESIRNEGYNLNIPRYVDSSDDAENWDIYATLFGGIPENEIDLLNHYWQVFPNLRTSLFAQQGDAPFYELITKGDPPIELETYISQQTDVQDFIAKHASAFKDFNRYLKTELVGNAETLNRNQQQETLAQNIFTRLQAVPLIDKYTAYQALDDHWQTVGTDLEIIQTEGFIATKVVSPHMVIKKKNGKETEVQEGWIGHVLPFELVQQQLLTDELDALTAKEQRLTQIAGEIEALIETLDEEDKDQLLNDANDAFASKPLSEALKDAYAEIETAEVRALYDYIDLLDDKINKPNKKDKLTFIKKHTAVTWKNIAASKDGTYSKTNVNKYLKTLQANHVFEPNALEANLVQVDELLSEERELKASIKKAANALHLKTKATIEALSDEQVNQLLHEKWVTPLVADIHQLAEDVITLLTERVQTLANKYAQSMTGTTNQLAQAENTLADMLGSLNASEFDRQGIHALQQILRGESQ